MARTPRSSSLETRTARARLQAGTRVPVKIGAGLALFYRRGAGSTGTWQARHWNGSSYLFASLGQADDGRDPDGVEVLDYWQAADQARRWAANAPSRARSASLPAPGRATVSDALDAYLEDYERRGGKALDGLRLVVDRIIRPEVGALPLATLATAELRAFLDRLATRGRAVRTKQGAPPRRLAASTDPDSIRARRATANRVYSYLRAALNFAFREGMVETDHAWRRVKPFSKVEQAKVRFLTANECTRLVVACEPELKRLVRAALLTGARFGELARLVVADYRADTAQVFIAPGKSGKARYVPLSEEGTRYFAELAADRDADAPMIVRGDGRAWEKNLYVRALAAACSAAGIVPAITLHELRHTYASLLAQAGCDLLTISKLLGHADTRVTSRHYAHLCDRTLAAAVTRLPKFTQDTPAKAVARA